MSDEEAFDEFWKVYPRKCNKGDARKAWKQTVKIRPPLADLVKAVYQGRASAQWMRDDGQYIPYPASYLRGERWADEYEVDLSQMHSAEGKVCAYCGGVAVGKVNGIDHCRADADKAMAGEKTKVISIGTKADPEVVDKKLQSCGS